MALVDIERSIASNSSHSRHRATPRQCMLFERSIACNIEPSIIFAISQATVKACNTSRRISCKLARNSCELHHLQHRKHQCKQLLRVASFAKSHEPMRAISLVTSLAVHNISYNTTSNIHATLDIFVRYFVQQIHGRSWIDRNFET